MIFLDSGCIDLVCVACVAEAQHMQS